MALGHEGRDHLSLARRASYPPAVAQDICSNSSQENPRGSFETDSVVLLVEKLVTTSPALRQKAPRGFPGRDTATVYL